MKKDNKNLIKILRFSCTGVSENGIRRVLRCKNGLFGISDTRFYLLHFGLEMMVSGVTGWTYAPTVSNPNSECNLQQVKLCSKNHHVPLL